MNTRQIPAPLAMLFAFASIILFYLGMPETAIAMAMPVAPYSPTTSSVDMQKIWRKVQGDLIEGWQFMTEEFEWLDDLQEFKIDWSAREILVPIDLAEGAGVASIPEGGYEARPSSPAPDELFLSWVLFNKRFTATKTAKWIDQKNQGAMIRRQIVYQGKKAMEAVGQTVGDYMYGFSTGVLATLSATGLPGAGTSGTYTLTNGYGLTWITNPSFIADKIKVGDWVALIRGGALVTNAMGQVTAKNDTNGTITVAWNGSVTAAAGDQVVKANSLENTTLAGTDFNRGLTGFLEMALADSVHSLSRSTAPKWGPALTDTAAGRFTAMDLQRHRTAIKNAGGGKPTTMLVSEGVSRDILANQLNGVRFDSPMNMELDGSWKAGGLQIKETRRVPPGVVMSFDRTAIRKMTLLRKPTKNSAPQWADGEKIPDRSAYVFNIDFPMAMVVLNRANIAFSRNKTEQ